MNYKIQVSGNYRISLDICLVDSGCFGLIGLYFSLTQLRSSATLTCLDLSSSQAVSRGIIGFTWLLVFLSEITALHCLLFRS